MSLLKLIPLGGMGKVTQNMFLYEYEDEMLIVDMGIGFPEIQMLGVDVLIPDVRYVQTKLEEGKKIVGMVLTHGHDDHIAATPYILPHLPEFPILASPLTAGFAKNRMRDGAVEREITVVKDRQWYQVGRHFEVMPLHMTHSVPDTKHYAIKTPEGIIYHGSDFKLDKDPIDGQLSDLEMATQLGQEGVLCMLIDCLRVERKERVGSESMAGPAIEEEVLTTKGKSVVTLMSSHIHRIQQVVDAAQKADRKICFIGRSVEQNVQEALQLKKLSIPYGMMVDKRDLGDYKNSQLCVVIAGSQGQEGSSLVRAVYGEHHVISITPEDKVIFSADVIPGNEIPFYEAIDELCRNGIEVVYPDIKPNLHQSGHASAQEQQELVRAVKPKYILPVGGADRHRVKFVEFVAEPLSIAPEKVLIPAHGEVLGFEGGQAKVVDHLSLHAQMVDGLGIGDVGPTVLADRRILSEAGMIVLVIPKIKGQLQLREMQVISRGFVFMKEADEVVKFIKDTTAEIINSLERNAKDDEVRRAIEKRLSRRLYKIIKREPMIMAAIVKV
ncbi:MAG TPA: ribonuclease J [Patescibacteria group bacterium]